MAATPVRTGRTLWFLYEKDEVMATTLVTKDALAELDACGIRCDLLATDDRKPVRIEGGPVHQLVMPVKKISGPIS